MNIAEIQVSAMTLPEDERAGLEAKRRIEEMKSDPSSRRSWSQIKESLGR